MGMHTHSGPFKTARLFGKQFRLVVKGRLLPKFDPAINGFHPKRRIRAKVIEVYEPETNKPIFASYLCANNEGERTYGLFDKFRNTKRAWVAVDMADPRKLIKTYGKNSVYKVITTIANETILTAKKAGIRLLLGCPHTEIAKKVWKESGGTIIPNTPIWMKRL